MTRQWTDGDVALVTFQDEPRRCVRRGGVWMNLDSEGYGIDAYVTHARPLVVIDPEDREQVERLIRLQDKHFNEGDARAVVNSDDLHDMQAALREFADTKPPKPDEPQGLGAVVEDAEGKKWIRIDETGACWWTKVDRETGEMRAWADVSAVRELKPGVAS